MTRLCVAGDIHGDIDGLYKYLLDWQERTGVKLDGVVHVGDFGCYLPEGAAWDSPFMNTAFRQYWDGRKQIPIPTWVCPGNHEDYSVLVRWAVEPDRINNLHMMADGQITDVLGVKVGAIWGNFSYRSWMNPEIIRTARRNNTDSKKAMHIYRPSVELLKQAGEFDMLITHDAPARLMKPMRQPPIFIKQALGLAADEPAQGCPGFNELYGTSKCKYHYFGHFHSFWVCQAVNPRVVCLHCYNFCPEQSIEVIEF